MNNFYKVVIGLGVILLVILTIISVAIGVYLQYQYQITHRVNKIVQFFPPTITPIPTVEIPMQVQGKLQLFVLVGQSNISGRGDLPPLQKPVEQVYVFGNDFRWKVSVEPVDRNTDQVDWVSAEPDAGFGPGISFAVSLLEEKPDIFIGLIPCARGGASIEEWQPHLSDQTLYGACLKRIRAASTMGQVVGILFFQGETDAETPTISPNKQLSASQWANKFHTFVEMLRIDLSNPRLPVVFAQIGQHNNPKRYKNWEVVQKQQESVTLPCVTMITTNDLSLKDDVHLSTQSQKIVGQRFAQSYLKLVQIFSCLVR